MRFWLVLAVMGMALASPVNAQTAQERAAALAAQRATIAALIAAEQARAASLATYLQQTHQRQGQ